MPQLVSNIYIDAQTGLYRHRPFGLTHLQMLGEKAIVPFCSWYNHRFQLLGAGELSKTNLLDLLELDKHECMLLQLSSRGEQIQPNADIWQFCKETAFCVNNGVIYINGWFYYNFAMLELRLSYDLPIARVSVNEIVQMVEKLRNID